MYPMYIMGGSRVLCMQAFAWLVYHQSYAPYQEQGARQQCTRYTRMRVWALGGPDYSRLPDPLLGTLKLLLFKQQLPIFFALLTLLVSLYARITYMHGRARAAPNPSFLVDENCRCAAAAAWSGPLRLEPACALLLRVCT